MDPLLQQLLIALGLGLLVGLEREWTHTRAAGIRTFALITIMGVFCGQLAALYGTWVIVAGLLGVAVMLATEAIAQQRDAERDPGLTTEIAAMVMFLVGVALASQITTPAIITAGTVAVLLHWKQPLHAFVERIGAKDIRAIIRMALIALVILPLLPNTTYDRYEVLNPFKIWLLVVLICGISLCGYITYKFMGARAGTLLGGIFGGIISSTATTVSYARKTRHTPELANMAALVIMIASTIVFFRVAVEVAIVAPAILPRIIPPLAAVTGIMIVICVVLLILNRGSNEAVQFDDNDPTDFKAAVSFGLLYALVLVGVAAAKDAFGDRGLYVMAIFSGMTDMDAITLSTAQMVKAEHVPLDTGWRMMLIGSMSNMVFKAAAVAVLGHRRLTWRIAGLFAIVLAAGGAVLAFWPEIT